jgi:hypothetical protein
VEQDRPLPFEDRCLGQHYIGEITTIYTFNRCNGKPIQSCKITKRLELGWCMDGVVWVTNTSCVLPRPTRQRRSRAKCPSWIQMKLPLAEGRSALRAEFPNTAERAHHEDDAARIIERHESKS